MPQSRSRWRTNSSAAFLFATMVLAAAVAAAQTFPKATGRINDFANVIDSATEAELDRRLDQVERQTSSEIAVATIASLEGNSVEDYATRLFKEWGVGQATQDNGVLVLVAVDDRKMRVEVGYGLEGVLPDGLAGQVIRDEFTPRFKDNDYSGGIRNGVNRIADIVEKHQVLSPEELKKFNQDGSRNIPPYLVVIPFFGLFVTIGFGMLGIGLRSKTFFPILFGLPFGGMPLLMSLAFIGRLSLYTLVPWAVLMLIQGFRLGARDRWRDAFRKSSGSGTGGSGWTMGASSGGAGSSSSGSSSSFGGGSSGGGGASGSW